jgi:hypothetical protein
VGIFNDGSSFCCSVFFVQLLKAFLNFGQEILSNDEYKRVFKRLYNMHIHPRGELSNQPGLINTMMCILAMFQ